MSEVKISPEIEAEITKLLGRAPRGLEAVSVSDDNGGPMVIRVCSLVDDTPFPTLFWLVDAQLSYRIDREEARGLIQELQLQIDSDTRLQEAMAKDHERHIALRDSYLTQDIRRRLQSLGFLGVLESRGIGGIADFTRIRCLHTWYAAHLVEANTVGSLLDRHWESADADGL